MRILMLNRASADIASGGDVIQMYKTQEYLMRLGLDVDVSLKARPELAAYDIVHVFNVQGGTMPHSYYQISHAKRHGKPVVLSTIYWSHTELQEQGNQFDSNYKDRFAQIAASCGHPRHFLSLLSYGAQKLLHRSRSHSYQRDCIRLADRLLPNTQAEAALLCQDLGATPDKISIVPNAAESKFFLPSPSPFIEKWDIKDFVLCVARIEPRKNQLKLIEALEGSGLKLVFVGHHNKSAPYVRACMQKAGENALFIDHLDHQELPAVYAAAKVHVLPSWYETPGIASLEAALAGCNIVTTDRGGTKEYFADYAYYCDPADTHSIKDAVLKAMNAPRSDILATHVKTNFSWERVAAQTKNIYQEVLSRPL